MASVVAEAGGVLRSWWEEHSVVAAGGLSAQPESVGKVLGALVHDRLADLPRPGEGSTASRFDALSAFGELDLTLGRLVEAHTDALAIMAELDTRAPGAPDAIWAVWAAEPPSPKVTARHDRSGTWILSGRKPWCSAAGIADAALVTAEAPDGPRLFAADLGQVEVVPVDDPWPTIALAGTDTRSVDFHDAVGVPIGDVGAYLHRPGFWYGAVGVAAVWLGGARAIGRRLESAARRRDLGDLGLAHLGAVTAALAAARAGLADAATAIDRGDAAMSPRGEIVARSARAIVEDAATRVIDHVGRALGPGPLAMDADHAQRVADLQLYLRQSHGEADLAELGRRVVEAEIGL